MTPPDFSLLSPQRRFGPAFKHLSAISRALDYSTALEEDAISRNRSLSHTSGRAALSAAPAPETTRKQASCFASCNRGPHNHQHAAAHNRRDSAGAGASSTEHDAMTASLNFPVLLSLRASGAPGVAALRHSAWRHSPSTARQGRREPSTPQCAARLCRLMPIAAAQRHPLWP